MELLARFVAGHHAAREALLACCKEGNLDVVAQAAKLLAELAEAARCVLLTELAEAARCCRVRGELFGYDVGDHQGQQCWGR